MQSGVLQMPLAIPVCGGRIRKKHTTREETTMFRGYTQQTVDFMWGIRFNNERGWFMDHKEV